MRQRIKLRGHLDMRQRGPPGDPTMRLSTGAPAGGRTDGGNAVQERAKLSDVARLAGVSQATASRALNGLETVDPDLARRVHEATRKLGYRQNSLARGLRRRANNVVGVVVPDVTNPFFTDLVRGVEDAVGLQ